MLHASHFGELPDGRSCKLFSIKFENGLHAMVTDYGGAIVSLQTPDQRGELANICLGLSTPSEYATHTAYLGCLVGRFANRIALGQFRLDDQVFSVSVNSGKHHLHGGTDGFDRRVWASEVLGDSIRFSLMSPDGDQGYPGNLTVTVTYEFKPSELSIHYEATTDVATIVNLTNHSYFKLDDDESVLDHELKISADRYTPTDSDLIPTGEIRSVEGTPLNFTTIRKIGERMHLMGSRSNGYDHNFVLNREATAMREPAAILASQKSGRRVELFTDQPALQLYSGNFLDGSLIDRAGRPMKQHAGLCLETQGFPDAPNHDNFPSVILTPGQRYSRQAIFKFSTL